MGRSDQHPPEMRDDESDPADSTADRDLSGDDQRAHRQHQRTAFLHIDSESGRVTLIERENIEAPAHRKKSRAGDEGRSGEGEELLRIGRREAAEQRR